MSLPPNDNATRAALDALDTVAIDKTGTDCGGEPLDAGWPTTFYGLGQSTCLRDASRAAKQAYMVFTGRSGDGGAYRIDLNVSAPDQMKMGLVAADATGGLRRDEWQCPIPDHPLIMTVDFPDGLVEPGNAPSCQPVTD